MPNRTRVFRCSRSKFNQAYKAALQHVYGDRAANARPYAWAKHTGKRIKRGPDEKRYRLVQARKRAEAACGGPPLPGCPASPVSITRTRMDRGGYVDGRYFGTGAPLFYVSGHDYEGDDYIRAGSRDGVKAQLRKKCPGIRFGR